MNDFIGLYENAYSDEYCDTLISYHNAMAENGLTLSRHEVMAIQKEDTSIMSGESYLHNGNMLKAFSEIFWKHCYAEYQKKFSILTSFDQHAIFSLRIQKTEIGGGYHIWHCENNTKAECGRILNFILYLNDVEDGGETELLYYHKRIKPKKGTLLLFPAGLTHTHRGNPPLSNSKYILTGWVEM